MAAVAAPVLTVLVESGGDAPDRLDRLAGRFDVRVCDSDGLADALPGTDALLLWDFFNPALEAAWPRRDRLRWVHVAAAGVDAILFDGLRDSDVVLTNARGVFDRPIAEFVLASVLAQDKLLHASADLQRERTWRHREPRETAGSHALVVGTGGIGRATGRLLRAVGMRVTGAGRTARDGDDDFDRIVASGELARHVGDVDHLVNAAPLTPQTTGILDATVFAALPAHAHVVNVGRGRSLVEADLVQAIEQGQVGAASLDVFETEPLPPDSPLWTLPGVHVSAHMSGDVVGWRDRLADQFVDLAERWLAGQPLPYAVDKQGGFVATGAR